MGSPRKQSITSSQKPKQQKFLEVLERGFNLRLSNLTGSQGERVENRAEYMKRKTNFTIPMYDSYFDANLNKFHKSNRVCQHGPLKFNKLRGIDRTSAMVTLRVVSTQHVLDLKTYFLSEARHRPLVPACTDEMCCAFQANTTGIPEMVHALTYDETFAEILNCGLNLSNSHFKLHSEYASKVPSKNMLDQVLMTWGVKTHVDWPMFLVLCTVDLSVQYRDVALLFDAYSAYKAAKPVSSELDFQKMISYLTGGAVRDSIVSNPSLFQCGDFYSARHTCSFAEFVISIQPLTLQSYIMKSNARGMKLSVNFCGHTAPGNVGGPPAPGCRDPCRPLPSRPPLPDVVGQQRPMSRASSDNAKSLRYMRKIFV